jgi:phospholipase/carboxylesterase
MARIEREIVELEGHGIPRNRIMIAGFSQGGCLAARFVLTYPAEYWGVFILSGALPGLVEARRVDRCGGH